ncbi:hypothetical protein [Mucilaginibacter endophyticus]|uniref:hypothetical protein n=1 Tax=Mucilaginibacter endophyticus TaxID=2675003 RepID=UPI0012B16CBA|nr:hypothetical protein [Mucilaginibacter endophyticus]
MYVRKITNSFWPPAAVVSICTVILVVLVVTHAPHRYGKPLDIGMTLDLVIVLPLVPLLFNKQTGGSKVLASVLFTAGIVAASWLVPAEGQGLLRQLKIWIVPVIEVLSIAFLVIRVKKALSAYKKAGDTSGDFYTELKRISFSIIPNRVSDIVSSELAAMYYLFFNHQKMVYDDRRFSYHKETGTIALFGVLIFMVAIETTAFHLLLSKWSPKIAWVLTLISIYAGLQLWGMARAFFKRPIEITGDSLILRYGLLSETTVPLKNIAVLEAAGPSAENRSELQPLSPLKKLDSFNLVLKLHEPGRLYFIYGKVKNYRELAFHVDNKTLFREVLNEKLAMSAADAGA